MNRVNAGMMNKFTRLLPPQLFLTIMVVTSVSGIVDYYGRENGANNLLTVSDGNNALPGCDRPEYVSCVTVNVNWDTLSMDKDVVLPTG